MKLGIMQPYFFPYLGYFELIARTDKWVVFDVVQYNAKSWMNRNRILHPTQGWQYINVPVNHAPHGTPIKDIVVKDRAAALTRVLGQLEHYRKRAPHFRDVTEIVRAAFGGASDRLVDVNVATLAAVCKYLGIGFDYSLCSAMNLDLGNVEHAGQWALAIAKQLGASEYLNPPGGRDIFRQEEWDAAGIRLRFTEMPDFTYDCAPYQFVEHLSILDVLMWNEPAKVVRALRKQS
ncbi:MAG TPA: WbqC family protein [Pseudolabrys sp.]|nr:WbqC family protein [Pseudolabrys sp.]